MIGGEFVGLMVVKRLKKSECAVCCDEGKGWSLLR